MKPWLALIIGIAIGWLIGWLFDKWYRGRRSAAAQPAPAPVETRPVEIELPRPAMAAGASAGALPIGPSAAGAAAAAAAAVREEHSLVEAEHETPPEMNWEELYAEAQERTRETGLEPQIDSGEPAEPGAVAPAGLGSELPEAPASLPPEAVEALAPAADDLTTIEGIGPVYAARLDEAGIRTFARLAESTPEELAGIIQAPSWRKMYFSEWIEQAQLLRDQEHDRLQELQAHLFRRKKG